MRSKQTNLILVILAACILFGLSIWSWLKPADEYSYAERRHLAQAPQFSMQSLLAKDSFMSKFEKYTVDQFPMRETCRTVNALANKYIFAQKLVNGIYIQDGYAATPEPKLNQGSIEWALACFKSINERYLAQSNAYIAVIPDKGYFLASQNGYPSMDYEALFTAVREGTEDYAAYIDLTKQLSIENYYRTDTHWRQETLEEIAEVILSAMNAPMTASEYERILVSTDFRGVYAGQSALPIESEELCYLTNDAIDNMGISCLDSGSPKKMPMYDIEKASGRDGYEMFLSGSLALITIENPSVENGKQLIVFRDSFGSSIVPLLCGGYSKATVADIRYISPAFLDRFISFEGADCLFIYSTSVLNNSEAQLLPFGAPLPH